MKKQMFVTVAVAITTPALAMNNVWLTGKAGYATPLTSSDYDAQAAEVGAEVDAVQNQRAAWQLGVGYDWYSAGSVTLSSSLTYFNLGAVDLDYSATITEAEREEFYDVMAKVHPESGRGGAFALQLKTSPVAQLPSLGVGLSAGPTYWQQVFELTAGEEKVGKHDQAQFGWLVAPQLSYQVSQQWSVTGEWQAYSLNDEIVQMASIGIIWRPFAGKALEGDVSEPEPAVVEEVVAEQAAIEPVLSKTADDAAITEPEVVQPENAQPPVADGYRIVFAEQSRVLTSKQLAQEIADYLLAQPASQVVLVAYATDWTTPELNQYMSAFRAAALRDYLVQQGVDSLRISTLAMGDAVPASDPELGRALEIFFTP